MNHAVRQPYLLVACLLGGLAMAGPMSIDVFVPAIPAIATDLGIGIGHVELSLTAIFLGTALGQIIYGPVSDRYGRKPVALIAFTLFFISAIGVALADSLGPLIFWRFIQGLVAASGRILGNAAARDQYEKEQLGRLVSLIFIVSISSSVFMPLIGGYVAEHHSWRWIFYIMAGYAGFLILAVLFFFKETLPKKDPHAINPYSMAVNFARIVQNKDFLYNMFCGGFAVSGFTAFLTASAGVSKTVFDISPQTYSYFFSGAVTVLLITNIYCSRRVERTGLVPLMTAGATIQFAGGLAMLYFALQQSTNPWTVFAPMTIYLMGFALMYAQAVAGAMTPFGRNAGAASSLLGFLQFTMGALVSALLAIFVDGTARPMAIAVAVSAAGSALSLMIYLRHRRRSA